MASEIAQCRLRVEHASLTQEDQSLSETALLAPQPDLDNSSISASKDPSLLKLTDHNFSQEIRLKWMKAITELFMAPSKSERSSDVREFDLILKPDGTVKNLIDNSSKLPTKEGQLKVYPARYRIPSSIISRLDSGVQKARRTERFAMGCIHYELISGNELFPNLDKTVREEEIQACYVEGRFPDDVWSSPMVVRVLACWCPEFAKELLESKGNDSLRSRFINHVQKHPIRFGFQVLGGIASLASLVALPVLGAVGFAAAGPVAGSTAAAWQASIGLVEAGSFFAWCQSAAMGGAAVGGIMATGLTGAGVALSATVAGALDAVGDGEVLPDLKERFLEAWKRDVGETMREEKEGDVGENV